jgi:YidC/Oxa1 family membrane protein insertase
MQQLQPELKAIQAKYKDDKERQQQEMMRFYKENKVNPLGSCLPLVAQIPVFISLFYMLRKNLRLDICRAHQPHLVSGLIDLNHLRPCGVGHGAGFLFIGDLTNKATGATLIVLLALYVGSQLASSLMMSSATMDRNQRMIMLVMPLFFVFIFLQYPAGLLVYWITTNLWTIGQQFVVKRRIGPVRAPMVAATDGATSAVATGRASPKPSPKSGGPEPGSETGGNGSGTGLAGLGSLIRGRGKSEPEKAAVATKPAGPPPRPPRKKKKRSGRRR